MTRNQETIRAWLNRSKLAEAMPGSENLTLEQQIKLIKLLAIMNQRDAVIAECEKALEMVTH